MDSLKALRYLDHLMKEKNRIQSAHSDYMKDNRCTRGRFDATPEDVIEFFEDD